jgi:hypothetical protein
LSKLPVDLMPEFAAPVITVNTNYANVGPLEIEELITRPIEQSVSAVAGITRVESTSREGAEQPSASSSDGAPTWTPPRTTSAAGSIACVAVCPKRRIPPDHLQRRLQRDADHADWRRG